jgi:hypothetical protein
VGGADSQVLWRPCSLTQSRLRQRFLNGFGCAEFEGIFSEVCLAWSKLEGEV